MRSEQLAARFAIRRQASPQGPGLQQFNFRPQSPFLLGLAQCRRDRGLSVQDGHGLGCDQFDDQQMPSLRGDHPRLLRRQRTLQRRDRPAGDGRFA